MSADNTTMNTQKSLMTTRRNLNMYVSERLSKLFNIAEMLPAFSLTISNPSYTREAYQFTAGEQTNPDAMIVVFKLSSGDEWGIRDTFGGDPATETHLGTALKQAVNRIRDSNEYQKIPYPGVLSESSDEFDERGVRHYQGDYVGLDYTSFDVSDFNDLLEIHNLTTWVSETYSSPSGERTRWYWMDEDEEVGLVTHANPFTGEIQNGEFRELGYASRTTVFGSQALLDNLANVASIKNWQEVSGLSLPDHVNRGSVTSV